MSQPSIRAIAHRMAEYAESESKYRPRALPVTTPLAKTFWKRAREHVFVIQKCNKCGEYNWYPKPWCIECGSRDLVWKEISGKGTIYSYTTIYQVVQNSPIFEADLPFVLAMVELDEGPRMIAQLAGVKPAEVRIQMKVKAAFFDATSEISIPKFVPA